MVQLQNFIIKPSTVKVRTFTDLFISFSLNQDLPMCSSISLRFRGGRNNKNDWFYLQPYDPNVKGYVKTNINNFAFVLPILITGKDLLIKYAILNKEVIKANQTFTFEIKNTLVQSIVENEKIIDILVELPNKSPIKLHLNNTIKVVNDELDHFTIICPSIVSIGEKIEALIRAEDKYNNLVKQFSNKIKIMRKTSQDQHITIDEHVFNEKNEGILRIRNIEFMKPGIKYLEFEYKGSRYQSNPILCNKEQLHLNLYWGYIHAHTNKSDGIRDLEEYYQNLLNAGLDFGTSTEHDHNWETKDEDFKEIRNIVEQKNQTTSFVTLFGYEWGYWYTPGYGDICIYHENNSIPIFRSDTNKYNSTKKLIKNLLPYESKVLMIGHHTALRPGYRDWSTFDNRLEKLVEIYSTWGNQEYSFKSGNPLPPRYKFFGYGKYARKRGPILEKNGSFIQDALKRGYKLGFTAGGDDHFGIYPSGPLDPDNGIYQSGIMAIWAENLSRDSIWQALNQRSCYGTTGPRVIIEFMMDKFFMGSIIDLKNSEELKNKRIINIRIISPIRILKLELIRNNMVFKQEAVNDKIYRKQFRDNDVFDKIAFKTPQNEKFVFYYLRIFLENQNMAWSSPIWVRSI